MCIIKRTHAFNHQNSVQIQIQLLILKTTQNMYLANQYKMYSGTDINTSYRYFQLHSLLYIFISS